MLTNSSRLSLLLVGAYTTRICWDASSMYVETFWRSTGCWSGSAGWRVGRDLRSWRSLDLALRIKAVNRGMAGSALVWSETMTRCSRGSEERTQTQFFWMGVWGSRFHGTMAWWYVEMERMCDSRRYFSRARGDAYVQIQSL